MWFLPQILAELTGKPRHLLENRIVWRSDLFIPNLFILLRRMFWEQVGIQADVSCIREKGGIIHYRFHSLEALLSHIEAKIRGLIPRTFPIRIYFPRLAAVGGFPLHSSPYLLAIAYDTSVAVDKGPSAISASTAMTIASGTSLWTSIGAANPVSIPTTVKWNTTELATQAITNTQAGFTAHTISYLATPTSGTFNIDVVFAGACEFDIAAISLTGTAASPLGATGVGSSASATSSSVTVATGTGNSWVIDGIIINGNQTITVTGTNQTRRQDLAHTSSSGWQDDLSNIPTTTTGNYTPSYSWTPARLYNSVAVEVKPAASVAASTYFPQLLTLGVG